MIRTAVQGCTCAKLRRLTRRVTAAYDRIMVPQGMTVTQYSLLSQLQHLEGQSLSQIAAHLDMDRSSLTRTLKPLVEAGWVALRASPLDARARSVHLSPTGQAERQRMFPHWQSAQQQVNALLGEANTAQLHDWIDDYLPRFRPAEDV
jgi:DNA-binding MarR family transcriptional regulator